MQKLFTRFIKDEEGATAIEYGIIAGLISVVLVAAFGPSGGVSGALGGIFVKIAGVLNGAL